MHVLTAIWIHPGCRMVSRHCIVSTDYGNHYVTGMELHH